MNTRRDSAAGPPGIGEEREPDLAAERDATDREAAGLYLDALFGTAPEGSLIEVRFRVGPEMHRRFFPAGSPDRVVPSMLALSERTDVFVGVLPRRRRGGRREDLVDRGSVLWVDCDAPGAADALRAFRPLPSMVVASGGGPGHLHAYWLLGGSVALAQLERANRRLAFALGGDLSCCEPARILRPAGSVWHKADPPAAVRLLRLDPSARHAPADIVGRLDDPPLPRIVPRPDRETREDPLLAIPPAEYVERLTGRRVGRDRKVCCPFHDDHTPSLHAFAEPERGWYCFGCRRGGTIYDFAALLSGRGTRDEDFLWLRKQLTGLFLAQARRDPAPDATAGSPRGRRPAPGAAR